MFGQDYNFLSPFKHRHKEQRALVCGAGCSLNDIDFHKLSKDIVIFACNQATTSMDYCDYFCMTDCSVPSLNYFDHAINISKNIIGFGSFWLDRPTMEFYNKLKDKMYCLQRETSNIFNFDSSNNLLIYGRDVVHVTSHFAYLTGCSPIILAGVDLNYTGGRKYCKSTIFKKIVYWRDNSFDYSDEPSPPTTDWELDYSFKGWEIIKNQNPTIKFLNTNPKGRLAELFETISLESLYG